MKNEKNRFPFLETGIFSAIGLTGIAMGKIMVDRIAADIFWYQNTGRYPFDATVCMGLPATAVMFIYSALGLYKTYKIFKSGSGLDEQK